MREREREREGERERERERERHTQRERRGGEKEREACDGGGGPILAQTCSRVLYFACSACSLFALSLISLCTFINLTSSSAVLLQWVWSQYNITKLSPPPPPPQILGLAL